MLDRAKARGVLLVVVSKYMSMSVPVPQPRASKEAMAAAAENCTVCSQLYHHHQRKRKLSSVSPHTFRLLSIGRYIILYVATLPSSSLKSAMTTNISILRNLSWQWYLSEDFYMY